MGKNGQKLIYMRQSLKNYFQNQKVINWTECMNKKRSLRKKFKISSHGKLLTFTIRTKRRLNK